MTGNVVTPDMRLKDAVIRHVAFDPAVDHRNVTVSVADSGEDVADNETCRRRIEARATEVRAVMTPSLSSPRLTAAPPETPADPLRLATCPLCHTSHASLTHQMLQAGGGWRCIRCGQRWDARRLETVAAYAAWVAEHERVERRSDNAARQSTAPFPRRVGRNDPPPYGYAISTWDDEGGRPESTGEKASAECDQPDLAPACS